MLLIALCFEFGVKLQTSCEAPSGMKQVTLGFLKILVRETWWPQSANDGQISDWSKRQAPGCELNWQCTHICERPINFTNGKHEGDPKIRNFVWAVFMISVFANIKHRSMKHIVANTNTFVYEQLRISPQVLLDVWTSRWVMWANTFRISGCIWTVGYVYVTNSIDSVSSWRFNTS